MMTKATVFIDNDPLHSLYQQTYSQEIYPMRALHVAQHMFARPERKSAIQQIDLFVDADDPLVLLYWSSNCKQRMCIVLPCITAERQVDTARGERRVIERTVERYIQNIYK